MRFTKLGPDIFHAEIIPIPPFLDFVIIGNLEVIQFPFKVNFNLLAKKVNFNLVLKNISFHGWYQFVEYEICKLVYVFLKYVFCELN